MTSFQKMKLFEAFLESAPQATLQIGIVMQEGYTSPLQIVSIIISLMSLALGAADVYHLSATKENPTKEESSSAKWILILPCQLFNFMISIYNKTLS